jgi:hypothetical protein
MYIVPTLLSEKNTLLNFSGTLVLVGYVIGIIELFRRVPNVFIQEEEQKNNVDSTKNINKPTIIKITEPIKGLVKEKNYFVLNRVFTKVQINDTFLKLSFIDNSKIDGYPIFSVSDSVVKVNSAMNFETTNVSYPIVHFLNEEGYILIESDITGNFTLKDSKGNNYQTIQNGAVYYKPANLVTYIGDHVQNYKPYSEQQIL